MLLTALLMVCGNMFAQEETTVLWEAASGDALTTIYPDGNISLKWEEGGGDFAPKYSGESVYFYNGNRVTVAGVSTDVTIKKIVFTFSSGSASLVTCNASGKSESSYGITNSSADMTTTWEGETNSLIFRASQRTGVRYINSIEVTYTGGTTGPVVTAPELAITQDNIASTYDMDANGVFVVYYENKGTAAATNAKLTLYVDGEENASKTIGTLAIGSSSQNFWNAKYVVTKFEAGEHTVKLALTADDCEAVEVEKTVTFTKAAPQATFTVTAQNVTVAQDAASYQVVATVKNTSTTVDAEDVQVLFQRNIQNVAEPQTISLAAGEEKQVTFTVNAPEGGFTVGSLDYWVVVKAYEKTMAQQEITVTVEEAPVVETKDLAITEILGTIELANTTNNVRVSVVNNGNVDINDAVVTLKAGETMLGTATVSATKNGGTGFCTIAVASEGLEAGTLDVTATVAVDGDATPDDNTMTATLIVKEVPAPEATFVVTAADVEVLTTDATVKVVVNVKNDSEVKADQVEVKLLRGMEQKGESKYIFGLEGGAEQNVTIEFDNYESAGTYEMQAWAGKQATYFNVVVKEPVVDLAIEAIQGTIDLSATSSNVTVTVKNNGEAEAKDAKVTLAYGETVQEETVTVKAGEQGYAYFQVASEGLTAGELEVTATVEAEGDKTPSDNIKTATLTVKAAPVAEPTFSVTAENVTVPFGAESFDIVATVKNTSEVDAQGLTVKLLKGITEVDAKTLNVILAAGAETTVTFTVTEIGEAGKTATYYVQAGNAQAEVTVTFAEEAQAEVKDLAIEAIQGTIDLSASQSNVSVTVKNNGNVDVKNAKIMLSYGETTLEKAVSAKAGEQGYAYFQVASEGIEGETLAVTATVELEGDATPDDNTKTENLTVKAAPVAEAVLVLTAQNVEANYGEDINFTVNVKNTSDVEAKDVTVEILSGTTLIARSALSYNLEPGQSVDVPFTIEKDMQIPVGTIELHAIAGKYDCFFNVTVKEVVEPVIDMALPQIQGVTEINLKEENQVIVWYENKGNVATTAIISAKLNDTNLEAQTVENVKAEAQGYVTITLPTEGLNAGETATFEATISAQSDTDNDNNTLTKDLAIVSGEVAPAAEIAINPISGFEVEAGEQTVTVGVTLFNNGEVDAKDVKVELYKSYGDGLCEAQTVDVPAGEENNYKMLTFTFNYTFEAGKSYEFTAYTGFVDANPDNQMQNFTLTCPAPVADVAVAKIADIEATTEEDVVIAATLKNNSSVDAKDVKVGVYTLENMEYKLQGIMQTVDINAGEQAQVEFNLGKLAAGNYTYYVRITSEDANAQNNMQDVNVKVTEPIVPVVEVELTQVNLSNGHIDLAANGNALSVWVENKGNVDADATINVTLNGTALEAQTVNVKAGKNGSAQFILNTEGLVAGEKATIVATVTVEGNTSTTISETNEYDIVDSSVATEPVFAVTAENVTVPFGATNFEIKATVTNTSAIDAQNVEVKLTKGIDPVGEPQVIETLAGGASQELTFTVTDVVAGTYYVNVANNKAIAEVVVTIEDEPVTPVVEVALTQINLAGGQIDLAAENVATVWVENTGNVDAEATIALTLNGTAVGEPQTITVKAENNGYASFTLPTEGLVAGEKATVVATVTVADNTAQKTTETKEYDIVDSSVVTEPTFSVVAEDVTVPFGAESFDIVATITNNSEVTANGLTVTLKKGITEVETKTLNVILAPNESTTVTFTVSEIGEAGKTATYYVQAGKALDEVIVTFAEETKPEVVDLAITGISGTLSLDIETNYLMVFVENKGTVDVTGATVTLTAGETQLGTATVSAKANGGTGFCSIAVPASALTVGEFEVTATVTAEGEAEATLEDNTMKKTFTVYAPTPELSFTVEATAGTQDANIPVKVTVKNSEKAAAENVVVAVYDANSQKLGEATIDDLAAGAEKTVTINVENTYTAAGTYRNVLQVTVTGVEGAKWTDVIITEGTVGIAAIKAVYGENVQIFTVNGQKVNEVRKGGLYIINGKKTVIK